MQLPFRGSARIERFGSGARFVHEVLDHRIQRPVRSRLTIVSGLSDL